MIALLAVFQKSAPRHSGKVCASLVTRRKKNIVIEWRYGNGKQDRVSDRAAELVRLKVEVIVTAGAGATRSAKEATVTIPVVMTQDTDPVRNGFVASLARPGGNITGLSRLAPELSGKQVDLLKEIVPRLSRLAVFGSASSPANVESLKEIELATGVLGLKLQHLDVQGPKDFEAAFREASKRHADAVLMLVSGPVFNPHRTQVVDLAVKNRLPVIYRIEWMWKPASLCRTASTCPTWIVALPPTWTRSSKAPSPPTCRWSSPRNSNSSSTSKPPSRSD
jgi:ABC-type uncharacterized transport system substrate-binding protein